ncbi:long-chain fatty acid transport protein [Paucimonas lemoignei]|uniref:Long-chain fatty acid transport protein n=1 Tax=Paucimonas lemoignei TaxID=29443 RepID=A0A4R3HPE4_PAULE|nr:outer membrane protein transport protein [Paucimonas lemoignei]TCS32745.1 long-chain fatty acid transport protein [Paucimonas lemoignei]
MTSTSQLARRFAHRSTAWLILLMIGLIAWAPASLVHASGFALNEMSAGSVGNAHAGSAAVAEDLGTIFYNPAGLARMSGSQFMINGAVIRPSSRFANAGSSIPGGAAQAGGDAGGWAVVPAMYFATDLAPRLRFGIGLQAPFGLRTEYDEGWVGRYQALTSDLTTVNINPSLSYRLNDLVALGVGVSAQYADVKLSRAIDFGTICLFTVGAIPCLGSGILPLANDGKVTVKGNDWGFGYNFGVLLSPTDSARIGLSYRSQIKHNLSGNASYQIPANLPPGLAALPLFSNNGVAADVTLPESLILSGYMDISPQWAIMGDVSWMRWNRFDELRIRFNNGAPDAVMTERWRNTVRYAAAVNYRYNDAWKFRVGAAYDPTPVRDEFRSARIPDADRTWLSLGVQFKPSRQDTWDLGYAHIFVKDAPINRTEVAAGTQTGTYRNKVDILSLQYSRAF